MPLRNTTLNLPDDLVQRAKAYAAQHGTTMTAIIRTHLEAITGMEPPKAPEALEAYSRGLMDRDIAMRDLGLRDYADLLLALGQAGLSMPLPARSAIDNQATIFERIWKQSWKRCTLVVPDSGPFNSLWVAGQLELFIALDVKIIVLDAVYDELTSDTTFLKDREVKSFIDAHMPPFVAESTEYGQFVRQRRATGMVAKKGSGEAAIAEFLGSEGGLRAHLEANEPVLLLYEDRDLRVINRPPNLHLLSTVGLLRGLERVGLLKSADEVIHAMTHR